MDLQEDIYRLRQVIPTVTAKEVVNYYKALDKSVSPEVRRSSALQYFLRKYEISQLQSPIAIPRSDFNCLKFLLPTCCENEIKKILYILRDAPNKLFLASQILLRTNKYTFSFQKRKIETLSKAPVNEDPNSSQETKVADSTKPDLVENVMPSKIPKLVIKRSNTHGDFSVSLKKNATEPSSSEMDVRTDRFGIPISNTLKLLNDESDLDVIFPLPSTETVNNLNGISELASSSSSALHNSSSTSTIISSDYEEPVAGPSGLQNRNVSTSTMEKETNDQHKNVDVIDLRFTTKSPDHEVQDVPFSPEPPPLPVDEKLVFKIREVFPNALPDYIRKICSGREWSEQTFDEVVDVILSTEDYPKRPEREPTPPTEVDPEEQLKIFKALLPDADPSYLEQKPPEGIVKWYYYTKLYDLDKRLTGNLRVCPKLSEAHIHPSNLLKMRVKFATQVDQLIGNQEAIREFIEDALINHSYPTMKDYLRKQQLSAQQRQYTSEFDVERFVKLIPDPVAIFEDPNRVSSITENSDYFYVKWFIRCKYSQLYAKHINDTLTTVGYKNIISIVNALEQLQMDNKRLKKKASTKRTPPDSQNIPLLQELAYFEHKDEILAYLKKKKEQAEVEKANCKELGLMQECKICYDNEVMPQDILTCPGGCKFCKDCIKRSTEVKFGDGVLETLCLTDGCKEEFSLQVLQCVLDPKLFSKLAQKKAVAEIKAAGLEDLESCPFCDFAHIPDPKDKLFRCLNPDCMKESCRLCKEPSHVPLRCEEVEKDQQVQARTYIENKMTEALIRECWKCGAKFIKEEGCNKMTCSCGAMMCYICRQPVKDYRHFNGQGGDRYDLCPLYTDNFTVNESNVLKAAEEAKKEVDVTQLKNDPTVDLNIHFANQIKTAKELKRHRLTQQLLADAVQIGRNLQHRQPQDYEFQIFPHFRTPTRPPQQPPRPPRQPPLPPQQPHLPPQQPHLPPQQPHLPPQQPHLPPQQPPRPLQQLPPLGIPGEHRDHIGHDRPAERTNREPRPPSPPINQRMMDAINETFTMLRETEQARANTRQAIDHLQPYMVNNNANNLPPVPAPPEGRQER